MIDTCIYVHLYNVKVHFDSLYNAGDKHSLGVYTRNKHDFFCVKTTFGPFFTSNYRSFHFVF